jgi:hypothetical protein
MTKILEEIWKPIPNFENYEASSFGRIRSIDRRSNYKNISTKIQKGKIITPYKTNKGYLRLGLRKNNKCYQLSVHRLIALSFIENTNNYSDVNHINMVKTDNNVENLEWLNNKENLEYSKKNNPLFYEKRRGEKHHSSSLTETQVKEIKYLNYIGFTDCQIRDFMKIDRSIIYNITSNRLWKHIII